MVIGGRPINPGDLSNKVTLLSRPVSEDAGGFQTPGTRMVLAHVWARWQNVHGGEVWASQAANAKEPATLLIRYRPEVNQSIAVCAGWIEAGDVDEADVYEVISADNIRMRNEYIELKVQRTGAG